ncbi:glycosyltransferase family 9 protein [Occallatibacter savannae]|uniref:glycosyltransferase family 9 protein n=1 Tax=Occallatibacter savannae TaxID=1002691 RepID=UPI0013A5824C|nr:glycosyltransferase family 9 protein [Occallatibacter savannae]
MLSNPRTTSSSRIDRILVAYPGSNLGDVILMMPMLEAIRHEWPAAELDVVVNSRAVDVLDRIPWITSVYGFDHGAVRLPGLSSYKCIYNLISLYRNSLMGRDYDIAIDPRWGRDDFWGNFLVYLSGAPVRCGYSGVVEDGKNDLDAFFTKVAIGGHHEHETLRDLRVLSRSNLRIDSPSDVSIPTHPISSLISVSKLSSENLSEQLKALCERPYIVFSPAATKQFRCWPLQNFGLLAAYLRSLDAISFVIVGSEDDSDLCDSLVKQIGHGAVSLAGETTVIELISLLSNAKLFVGNDSGPAHIAGALGTPTVVISPFPTRCTDEHPNSPVRFRPCGPKVAVLQPTDPLEPCWPSCSWDEPHCIAQVSVGQVAQIAKKMTWD